MLGGGEIQVALQPLCPSIPGKTPVINPSETPSIPTTHTHTHSCAHTPQGRATTTEEVRSLPRSELVYPLDKGRRKVRASPFFSDGVFASLDLAWPRPKG